MIPSRTPSATRRKENSPNWDNPNPIPTADRQFKPTQRIATGAAAVAMRCVGLNWRSAVGMGLGLSQLGEFSFLLVAEGVREGIISPVNYNRMLVIALGTLVLTPQFLRWGLHWTSEQEGDSSLKTRAESAADGKLRGALVIGIGPIGRQIAS